MTPPPVTVSGTAWGNRITGISQHVLNIEKYATGLLMLLLLSLILLNVGTRAMKSPIYWIDEASILAMVWLGFIGASVMTRIRIDFAVTLLGDALSSQWRARLRALASAGVFAFAVGLMVMCWNWLDPVGIASHGFDARGFAGASFNFLYTERTQTLEWPTWLVNLVLPLFSVTLTLHAAANLLEDTGLARRREQMRLVSAEEAL